MRKTMLFTTVLLIGALAWAWADSRGTDRPRNGNQGRVGAKTDPGQNQGLGSDPDNLLAIHDVASSSYNGDCLSCHSGVLTEQTEDPRILSFHQAMLPFTPGYNPRHGASNDTCVQCHRHVDLVMDSAGALRKQVDPALCALCHGPSGPGPVYYAR